jgi:hypothetical protein
MVEIADVFIRANCAKAGSDARSCLCTICTISTYKDIRNFNHALWNSLMMDMQYPKNVGEEMTTACFKF